LDLVTWPCWAPELRFLNDHLLKWVFPAIEQAAKWQRHLSSNFKNLHMSSGIETNIYIYKSIEVGMASTWFDKSLPVKRPAFPLGNAWNREANLNHSLADHSHFDSHVPNIWCLRRRESYQATECQDLRGICRPRNRSWAFASYQRPRWGPAHPAMLGQGNWALGLGSKTLKTCLEN
jgi:hypothetical protein